MATDKPDMTDSDGDLLPDSFEREIGTDPHDPDTDGDHLDDGMEVHLTTDPLRQDTDGDHLTDWAEVQFGTDPELRDTDGDGANDGTEIATGTLPRVADRFSTHERELIDEMQRPFSIDRDADQDGIPDTTEHRYGWDDGDMDGDGDGLGDWVEMNIHGDPTRVDSDGDGTSDLDEVEMGRRPDLGSPARFVSDTDTTDATTGAAALAALETTTDASADTFAAVESPAPAAAVDAEPGAVEMPEIEMPAEYVGAVEMPEIEVAAADPYEAESFDEPEVALYAADAPMTDDFTVDA
jgi:hypothetical protein